MTIIIVLILYIYTFVRSLRTIRSKAGKLENVTGGRTSNLIHAGHGGRA